MTPQLWAGIAIACVLASAALWLWLWPRPRVRALDSHADDAFGRVGVIRAEDVDTTELLALRMHLAEQVRYVQHQLGARLTELHALEHELSLREYADAGLHEAEIELTRKDEA